MIATIKIYFKKVLKLIFLFIGLFQWQALYNVLPSVRNQIEILL